MSITIECLYMVSFEMRFYKGVMCTDSLWMHLIQRSIDAHGGAQTGNPFVFLQPQQDAGQSGSDQVGRAEGDDSADLQRNRWIGGQLGAEAPPTSELTSSFHNTHVLHSDAVLGGRLHSQSS